MIFEDYVRGRSIAVVGPAPLPYDQSAEIDAHDLVYRANNHYEAGPWYGQRVDIMYLNTQLGRKAHEDRSGWWRVHADRASWWVFKKAGMYRVDGLYRTAIKPPCRNPNAVTGILWDLTKFDTGPITVYGADLYAGGPEANYHPGYNRHHPIIQYRSMLDHRPMKQMRVHRRVVETGKVVGDDRYLKAVSLTDEKYQAIIDRYVEALARLEAA